MFVIKAPGAAVVTTSEAKRDIPGTFRVAERHRVYVTKDGQPIGGMVSMSMMAILEETLADRETTEVAASRLQSVRDGGDDLLDADDFFSQADAMVSRSAGVRVAKGAPKRAPKRASTRTRKGA